MQEVRTGYPDHAWLAIGQLDQAIAESLESMPALAAQIQEHKKLYEEAVLAGRDYHVPTLELIRIAGAAKTAAAPAAAPADDFLRKEIAPGLIMTRYVKNGVVSWHTGRLTKELLPKAVALAEGATLHYVHPETGAMVVRRPQDAPGSTKPPAKVSKVAPQEKKVAKSPDGCHACGEKQRFERLVADVKANPEAERLVILTTLSDWNPAYSLTSAILDQANAAAMAGYKVSIWMHEGANLDKWPHTVHPGVEVAPVVPKFTWTEDVVDAAQATKVTAFLGRYLAAVAPCSVISHDLLFQSWFLTAAKGIHDLAPIEGVRWWHMAHSGLGNRSSDAAKRFRYSMPVGHRLMVLSETDVARGAAHYAINRDRVDPLPNARDPRSFLSMPAEAADLLGWSGLHLADVAQVYPYSAERAFDKGVDKVVALFGALTKAGAKAKLLLLDAHLDDRGKERRTKLKALAADLGFEGLHFASERIANPYAGVNVDGVRSLMACSNLFAFPTISEAGSLVLMEASQSGCLLVLNDNVMALKGYVGKDDAIWVPWGNVPGKNPVNVELLAEKVLGSLNGSMTNRSKRRTLRENCLETYASRLRAILSKR